METTTTTNAPHLATEMNLADWDIILVNSSAGKDSQTILRHTVLLAEQQGVKDRVLVVHADLGRSEWEGAPELAKKQADLHGVPFVHVSRPQGDLLQHVLDRGMWPSSAARYCTSDHKRGQVLRVITQLVKDAKARGITKPRILNVMGLRAQESAARAKKQPLTLNKRATNQKRTTWDWLPILFWTEAEVWADIHASGIPHHHAYDAGMPRLSCVFCPFAPRDALLIAGRLNPEKLAQHVAVEKAIGHTFKADLSLAEIQDAIAAGEQPKNVTTWTA